MSDRIDDSSPSVPAHEVARQMMNAIGWDSQNWRLRDRIAQAIAPEVRRLNDKANKPNKFPNK
jgi:hypothetical protein